MKKVLITLGSVIILAFTGCGGASGSVVSSADSQESVTTIDVPNTIVVSDAKSAIEDNFGLVPSIVNVPN